MKNIFAIAICLACVVLVLMRVTKPGYPSQTNLFASYDEARERGAIAAGWVPAFLPRSATNIWEEHSENATFGRGGFSFARDDMNALTNALQCVTVGAGHALVVGRVADGEYFQTEMSGRQMAAAGWRFYVSGKFMLAVHAEEAHAVYWIDAKEVHFKVEK